MRRGDLVTGVTTAATLRFIIVVGLCFGGGQLALGSVATILGVVTLSALRWLGMRIPREQRAKLVVESETDLEQTSGLAELITSLGYRAKFRRRDLRADKVHVMLLFDINWMRSDIARPPWELLRAIEGNYRVMSFELTSEDRH